MTRINLSDTSKLDVGDLLEEAAVGCGISVRHYRLLDVPIDACIVLVIGDAAQRVADEWEKERASCMKQLK